MSPDGMISSASGDFLEVTLISAQDLFPASSSRSLRTYAVTYLHPSHPLRTHVDSSGHTSPTWNDKFMFRLDPSTLLSDTSGLQINIFASRPRFLNDTLLGSSRAILSTLNLSPSTRLFAIQILRPSSLRPHGILTIGFALTHPSSLPQLSTNPPAAFAYHDLTKNPAAFTVLPRPPQPVFDRSGSAVGAGERERVVLEKKLEKWRSEIWAPEEDRMIGWEKLGEATDDEGGSRKGKAALRRPRAMSCFNLAGHYADEIQDQDDDHHSNYSSTSSWSSTSLR